jgi:hypothetical protein
MTSQARRLIPAQQVETVRGHGESAEYAKIAAKY